MFDVTSSHVTPKQVRRGSVVRIKNIKTKSNSFFDGWFLVKVTGNIQKSEEITVFNYGMIEPSEHPYKNNGKAAQQFAWWNKKKGRWEDSDPKWEIL